MAAAKHDSQGPKGQRPEVHIAQSCELVFFFFSPLNILCMYLAAMGLSMWDL